METRPRPSYVRRSLAFSIFAMVGAWSDIGAAAPDGGPPLQLEIQINGDKTGQLGSFLQLPDGTIAARRSELVEAGVKIPGSGPPDDLVVLKELLGEKFQYDEPAQSISFDLTDNQRVARTFDAMASSAQIPVSTSWGSVLNYTLFGSETSGLSPREATFSGASASLEARMFSPYGTLSQSGIVGTTTTRDMTMLRLETSFAYSHPESLVTYRAGDSVSGALAWTRSIRFGGIQAQRNFAMRSDLVTAPLPSFSGSAAVPSTLDVYLNNSKTYTQEVPPGPFQVNNLPLISGGEARLVLRDATGREVETTLPFYTSPQLLREDLTYFSVETGYPRIHFGTELNDYVAKEFASMSVRHGLYDWLTLEGHAEEVSGLYNGGAGILARTGNFGILSAAASGSWYKGQGGLQTYLSFETKIWGISFSASSTRTFMSYNDIASVTAPVINALAAYNIPAVTASSPPKAIDRLTAGFRLPDFSSLGLSFVHLEPASGVASNLFSAALVASRFCPIPGFRHGFCGCVQPPELRRLCRHLDTDRRIGLVVHWRDVEQERHELHRPMQVARWRSQPGSYGWRVRDSEGAVASRSAAGSYRSSVATVQAGVEQSQGTVLRGIAQVDGAIATMGNGVFATNRIDDSFAVVDAGIPGVPVLYENRPAGETNGSGQLLVPNLRAYGSNKISIDPKGLGVNDEIETTEAVVAPADRSGVLVKFNTKSNVQAAVVVLVGAGGKPLAVGSRGKLDGGDAEFVVGYDGRAFVKDLKGANAITVSLEKGECHASFDYAAVADRQVVVGPISCL